MKKIQYRQELIAKRAEKEMALSSAFFLFVFHNEYSTLEAIENFLDTHEKNEGLRAMLKDAASKAQVNSLLKSMEYCESHPSVAVWYVSVPK